MTTAFARRRLPAVLAALTAAGSLAVAGPANSSAAPAAAGTTAVAPRNCPAAYPVKALHRGMRATGYTTSQGRTPKPFAVRVLGVLRGALGPGIGVDLIVIRVHSPAIERAGGVWAGMSGSPIYARDGRLLGALSYSFSFGPSDTAGVTPAADMYRLFGIGHHGSVGAGTGAVASRLRFDKAARTQLVRSGAATARQAAGGMQFVPTPITVSGVPGRGMARVHKLMSRVIPGPFRLESGGAVAPDATAPVATMRPGAPFAAAISSGAVTMAGIGTTTAVCNGRALAFGHPMLGDGATQLTAHTGTVLYVQPDPTLSPFVLANVGGRTGVVNQDRLTGLRARLGAKPAHQTTIVTRIAAPSTGMRRTARSYTALTGWVDDTAAYAVYGGIASTLLKYGSGTAKLAYAIRGSRVGGGDFELNRSDYVASKFDIANDTANNVYMPLSALVENPFRRILIHRVDVTARVSERYQEWTVRALQNLENGRYVTARRIPVTAGQTLHLRAKLVEAYQLRPVRYVRYDVTVPKGVRRSGDVAAVGGNRGVRQVHANSFEGLLRKLRRMPHNASLSFTTTFRTDHGTVRDHRSVRLGRVVSGEKGVTLVPAKSAL